MEIGLEQERKIVASGFDPEARELLRKAVALLRRITYQPKRALGVYVPQHTVHPNRGTIVLTVQCEVLDSTRSVDGNILVRHQHEIPLMVFDDEKRALQCIRDVLRRVEIHEADEWLQVDGVAPFYPH